MNKKTSRRASAVSSSDIENGHKGAKNGVRSPRALAAAGPVRSSDAHGRRVTRATKSTASSAEVAEVEVRRATLPPPAAKTIERLAPVKARPSRSDRAMAEARAQEIDDVCAAWAAIVAERMAADQQFAECFERYQQRPRDLRGLFLWDQLHAAESHVALVNAVIAKHLDGRRADPFDILAELRLAQQKLAVVYAVNAFLAVLNQMSPHKPKWLPAENLDSRMAVLALAHQTLEYALEAGRVEAPSDLTEQILEAAQDESVWSGARDQADRTLAACAATAVFFRTLGAQELSSIDEVVSLYETYARSAS